MPTTLVLVCCHAIYTGGSSAGTAESEWLIEPFQSGETATFIEHIRAGIADLVRRNDDDAILVFSGGATKPRLTTKTEAQGYFDLAVQRGWLGDGLQQRTFREGFATDSFQNVLLALIQFSVFVRGLDACLGRGSSALEASKGHLLLPERLVIVSHEFKRARFVDLHVPAIKAMWPGKSDFDVEFVGINPEFDEVKIREIEEGDRKRGYGVWKDDLYGSGSLLAGKRIQRGWDEKAFMDVVGQKFEEADRKQIQKMLNFTS